MFIITVSVPDHSAKIYEPTRLIIGCQEQAIAINAMLQTVGIEPGVIVPMDNPPKRDKAEMDRAERLLALLFMPAQGSA